jgi:multidrug efflux pump subunit AcrA (membrane-fusion protein)
MEPPKGVDIKPGMTGQAWAEVEFPDDIARNGIEVPVSALFSRPESNPGRTFVWVIDEDSLTVSSREVTTGGANERGVIARGLEAGERIATAGVHSLHEGEKIRLTDDQVALQGD